MDAYIKIEKDNFYSFKAKASEYKTSLINLKIFINKRIDRLAWYRKTVFNRDYIILNNKLEIIDYYVGIAYNLIELFSQDVDCVYLDFYTYNNLVNKVWKDDFIDI